MDHTNPAITKHLPVSPADLEKLGDDSTLLGVMARKMLYIQMHKLHHLLGADNVPVGQRQNFADFLAKVGDAYPKANAQAQIAQGTGFSVKILLSQSAIEKSSNVIDAVEVKSAPTIAITATATATATPTSTNDLIGSSTDE